MFKYKTLSLSKMTMRAVELGDDNRNVTSFFSLYIFINYTSRTRYFKHYEIKN